MIQLMLTLAIVGFVLWLLLTYVPMPDPFKKLLVVLVVVCVIVWLMGVFGVADVPVPRLK